ncbi:MAG TPA: pilus assembly protein N-terminal domain-containing protein [Candidatus Binataceae bacterium]|nr:pilus assembly protein N-terminal domain-containing protein [Candidatus Binataceae bacterium]
MSAARPAVSALAVLIAGLLALASASRAQEAMAVGLKAGETFMLADLSADSTPEVKFIDNPNAFVLECSGPGKCSVLATQAGRGRVRARLDNGESITYDISVSAVSQPGKPLEAGTAPHPAGDIFANHHPAKAQSSAVAAPAAAPVAPPPAGSGAPPDKASYPAAAAAAPAAPASAPAASPLSGDAAAPMPHSARPAVIRYTQNPAANALELPPGGPAPKHYLPATTLKLTAGASRIFDFPTALTRVAVADTEVADVTVVGPSQVMVVAHKPGATTLSVWQDDGEYFERPVRVEQGGPQQVQLRVVVAELDRNRLEEQGLDIAAALSNAGISVVGLQGAVATPYNVQTNLTASGGAGTIVALPPNGVFPVGGQLIPLLLSTGISYGFASTNGQWTTNAMFQILEQHDLAKILAEPMLIAASGEQAKFLSGGEIPIVIAQALNTSIVFKQFGTSVIFVPTVIDDDEIELKVAPEFSQPDYTQGVQMFGFNVPAFVTRRAQTLVRMRENQTLILAGLVLDNINSEVRKTRYLGDVPYLGYLFKHTYYHRTKSELVMTVTPQIIRPIPAGVRVALPTEHGPLTPEEIRTRPVSPVDASRPRFQ